LNEIAQAWRLTRGPALGCAGPLQRGGDIAAFAAEALEDEITAELLILGNVGAGQSKGMT